MKKSRILVVEDDVWLAEQHIRVLEKAGYSVTVSPHTIAAIEAIDDIHPSVIILDVLLPGTTAFTLLHEVQSHSDIASIPVILCTNLASDLKLDDLHPYGVKRLLDKTTMEPSDIVSAVRSVL
jgi:two-component system OmpR family response regulator